MFQEHFIDLQQMLSRYRQHGLMGELGNRTHKEVSGFFLKFLQPQVPDFCHSLKSPGFYYAWPNSLQIVSWWSLLGRYHLCCPSLRTEICCVCLWEHALGIFLCNRSIGPFRLRGSPHWLALPHSRKSGIETRSVMGRRQFMWCTVLGSETSFKSKMSWNFPLP